MTRFAQVINSLGVENKSPVCFIKKRKCIMPRCMRNKVMLTIDEQTDKRSMIPVSFTGLCYDESFKKNSRPYLMIYYCCISYNISGNHRNLQSHGFKKSATHPF